MHGTHLINDPIINHLNTKLMDEYNNQWIHLNMAGDPVEMFATYASELDSLCDEFNVLIDLEDCPRYIMMDIAKHYIRFDSRFAECRSRIK